MNFSDIEKRLRLINKQKKDVTQHLFSNVDILNELMAEDPTWAYFIKSNFSLDDEIYIEDEEGSSEEYLEIKKIQENKKLIDNTFTTELEETIQQQNRYYEKINFNIGLLVNDKLYEIFKDVANITRLNLNSLQDSQNQMNLFIISNTYFEENPYYYKILDTSAWQNELINYIEILNQNSIPSIFYDYNNDTDFTNFIPIAEKCETILTNSRENKRRYESQFPDKNIIYVEYAVNPHIYNPIGKHYNKETLLFKGFWDRHDKIKTNNLYSIFQGVLNSEKKVAIIDEKFSNKDKRFYFPKKLVASTYNIENNDNKKINKGYDLVIAFNKQVESHDLIDESIYQALAMSNVVFTNYNPAINNKFPHVFIANSQFETTNMLQTLSEKDILDMQVEGLRNIMTNDNSFLRIEDLLCDLGLRSRVTSKRILVVGDSDKECIEAFNQQTLTNKKFVTWDDFTLESFNNSDFIAFFSKDFEYGAYYLEDLVNGFKYSDSDFICKSTNINTNYKYNREVESLYLAMFDSQTYSYETFLKYTPEQSIKGNGLFIDNTEWKKINRDIIINSGSHERELSVIVPIYNNGKYLMYKCFQSLKRSSIFNEMEILFVDDGSTDEETIRITNRIYRENKNVKLYRFNDGGSGSASRPRNKGLDLASCKYITYLDPDNEALNDGYAQLLYEIKEDESYDTVIGNIIRFDNKKAEINYYKYVHLHNQMGIIEHPFQLLKDTSLKVQSIQAMIIKRDLLVQNQLKMVESAAGQDTLFFQEVMTKAKKAKAINVNIHLYYAAVSNSVTNTISSRFYEKYYKVELERIKFLKKNNLFEIYLNEKFVFYFTNWYLKRLILIKEDDENEAIEIIKKIYDMYAPYIQIESSILRTFEKYSKAGENVKLMSFLREYFRRKTIVNKKIIKV
ncbi:glycosyltransferase family 2 protein [Saliterribacillus persicus]|uniref:Glycosyltransferase involved in cell wall biosynthesis n=1 Tax=Saliterribacillus persicus TaxID=930114 RepID=A0A368YB24_9BACI|nr:glycosyltransferase family 2 protein [Saliterribacillus persicus]RCW77402.1 glycosyltransferase involved in cell wall biosynthesis [Saliterribacillus persicus]